MEAKDFLISKGYIFNGSKITPPDADGPLDAISVKNELEDNYGMTLRYIGDNLTMIEAEI